MKPKRLEGTCYNGMHWLDKEDCQSCSMKNQCIELNAKDAINKSKTEVTTIPSTEPIPKQVVVKTTTNARAIENELLTGGDLSSIVRNVVEITKVSDSKIRNQIKGIRHKIHDKSGKWAKYQDISDINGHLQIKLL